MIIAFEKFGIPYPSNESGLAYWLAEPCMAWYSSKLLTAGWDCHKQTVNPEMIGEAKEVPSPRPMVPSGIAMTVCTPIAARFGFTLPAVSTPTLLNDALVPEASTAAMASTSSPSAGALMQSQPVPPSFPALTTTAIPLLAAKLAPMVEGALCPFISAQV